MNYEKHDIKLNTQDWSVYTPLSKDNDLPFPSSKGFAYLERIGTELRTRYYVTTYRPTMQGTTQISMQTDSENLSIPKMIESGVALPVFTVREDLTTVLFNLPTGQNSRGENDGKFLSRALCEKAMEGIFFCDIIPFDLDTTTYDWNPIQPLTFTLTVGADSVTVNIIDVEVLANVQVSLDGTTWQSELTFNSLASGNYTIYVKERESIVLTQEFTIE